MANDFERDNIWQRGVRDRILAPAFYGVFATEGRYVFVDKGRLATMFQKRFAVDTFVQGREGAALCIEEKIVRWPERNEPYTAFCLETRSCTVPGRESDGWMRYGQADYLLYAFQQADDSLIVYLVDFQKLQEWFWPREGLFKKFGPLDTLNRSEGRVVPIVAVRANVPTYRRSVKVPATSIAAE